MAYDDSYSNQPEKVSKYNEAGMQIMRLHELWLIAENSARKSLLSRWKFILDSIWRELYPDVLKSQSPTRFLKLNLKLKQRIAKSKTKTSLYNSLDIRHQFLKYIQDVVGKGSIYGYADNEDPE